MCVHGGREDRPTITSQLTVPGPHDIAVYTYNCSSSLLIVNPLLYLIYKLSFIIAMYVQGKKKTKTIYRVSTLHGGSRNVFQKQKSLEMEVLLFPPLYPF